MRNGSTETQSRLFHSIVAVGLSLTGACGGTITSSNGQLDATTGSDGARGDATTHRHKDAAAVVDRVVTADGGPDVDAQKPDGSTGCHCSFQDGGWQPSTCPNPAGYVCMDAGQCFPCYV